VRPSSPWRATPQLFFAHPKSVERERDGAALVQRVPSQSTTGTVPRPAQRRSSETASRKLD
jgi:hypothetical protein